MKTMTDKERLDFLIKHEAHVGWCRDGEYCDVYKSNGEDGYECLNKPGKFFTDPRKAIDSVIYTAKCNDGGQCGLGGYCEKCPKLV